MIALPLGVVLGHLHRGSFVAISVANVGRALPSLVLIAVWLAVPRHRLREQHGRARRPGRPADPDERLRRRSTGSTGRRRGGAGDGMTRARDPAARRAAARAAAASSPASGSRRSSSSRPRRSPRSPAAAGSATSSSTRRATGSRASSARRSCVSLLAFAVDGGARARAAARHAAGAARAEDATLIADVVSKACAVGSGPDLDPPRKEAAWSASTLGAPSRPPSRSRSGSRSSSAEPPRRRPATQASADDHRSARRTSPRSSSSASSTSRRSRRRASRSRYKENIGTTELIDTALTSGKINFYPEYTGVDRCSSRSAQDDAEDGARRRTRWRRAVRGEARLHAAQADAVLRHRRVRRD